MGHVTVTGELVEDVKQLAKEALIGIKVISE
jgi:hypothetical protein